MEDVKYWTKDIVQNYAVNAGWKPLEGANDIKPEVNYTMASKVTDDNL